MGMCHWMRSHFRDWIDYNGVDIIFADEVFIDPTFSGIFVGGPLQSFVLNLCTIMGSHFQ